MAEKNYDNGYILIDGGKIIDIGDIPNINESDVKTIDAKGKYLLPGFIDAHTHVGMWEDGIGFEGDDGNEETDPITPHLKGVDGVNPFDRCFTEALENGITTVATGPGSANVIGGQFVALKTKSGPIEKMVIKEPFAMKVAFGENPKTVYNSKHQSPMTRMATAALLRETLIKAKEYNDNLKKYNEDSEENDKPEFDFKLESIIKVLNKEIPLKIHAHRADDIMTAIRICKEFDLDYTIDHCTEGHLILDYLVENKVKCIVGPSLADRSKIELKNLTFKTPGLLAAKGLDVAIITDHPVTPIQYLPVCAAIAVKEGMKEVDALKAITINAAKMIGIEDRVGSIEIGKDADIVLFDGHPLDFSTKAEVVILSGEIVFSKNDI